MNCYSIYFRYSILLCQSQGILMAPYQKNLLQSFTRLKNLKKLTSFLVFIEIGTQIFLTHTSTSAIIDTSTIVFVKK